MGNRQPVRVAKHQGYWQSTLGFPVDREDVLDTVKLAATALLSWLWPVEEFLSVARKKYHVRGEWARCIDLIVARLLSEHISMQHAYEIDLVWRARHLEERMQILALHRPGCSWQPRIQMHGLEHLKSALERKSGALIWVSDFVYSSLITKMAFHQAGYEVSHLTRPQHGFSDSPYGVRVLNPLWTKIEDRYIVERISIDKEGTDTALELVRRRLSANRIVSITVGNWARRTLDLAFFKGVIRLATGPAHLSWVCHAPLLPVFTVRSDSGEYHVSIDAAIEQTTSKGDYAQTMQSYVKILEEYVLRYPDQWNGWVRNVLREPSDDHVYVHRTDLPFRCSC